MNFSGRSPSISPSNKAHTSLQQHQSQFHEETQRLQRNRSYYSPRVRRHNRFVQSTSSAGNRRDNSPEIYRKVVGGSVKVSREYYLPPLAVPSVSIEISSPEDPPSEYGKDFGPQKSRPLTSKLKKSRRRPTQEGDSSPDYSPPESPNSPWNSIPTYSSEMARPTHQRKGSNSTFNERETEGGSYFPCYESRRNTNQSASTSSRQAPAVFTDQFEEFCYKSKHIGQSMSNWDNDEYDRVDGGPELITNPPEVNIEVPSDSDSSRRPSKASFSGCYNSSPTTLSNASSVQNFRMNQNEAQGQDKVQTQKTTGGKKSLDRRLSNHEGE